VPGQFISAMKKARKGPLFDLWQKAGSKESGTWSEVLGWTPESRSFHVRLELSPGISTVWRRPGKNAYDIPMFINLWMTPKWWTIARGTGDQRRGAGNTDGPLSLGHAARRYYRVRIYTAAIPGL